MKERERGRRADFSNIRFQSEAAEDRPEAIVQLRGRSIEKFVALNAPGQKDLSKEREGERAYRFRVCL